MNHARELEPVEWTSFFNDFSRIYKGRAIAVEMLDGEGSATVIARNLALMGITAEPPVTQPLAIEVVAGEAVNGHLMHIINNPSHVRVQQAASGREEFLVIESSTDPTIRLDFCVVDAARQADDVFGMHPGVHSNR